MSIGQIAEQLIAGVVRTGFFPVNREPDQEQQRGGEPPDSREQHGGTWGEHPDYPVSDWQYEVANGDTRLGYWDWVEHARTANVPDEPRPDPNS